MIFSLLKKNEYQAPKQISLKDSEDAIKALLFSRKLADLTDKRANETLNYLNTSVNPKTKSFSVYKYDKKYSEEILNIINNQKIGQKFLSYKLKSGDYIFLRLDSINFDNIDNNKVIEDNFLDYIENTQSESDYNNLYITKYDEYEIDINQEFCINNQRYYSRCLRILSVL